jgi:hypothetical protein
MTREEIVLDVSELEAPLPLEIITRHLRELKPDQKLRVIHRMFPCVLPDLADKMRMKYTVVAQAEDRVELLIEHRGS